MISISIHLSLQECPFLKRSAPGAYCSKMYVSFGLAGFVPRRLLNLRKH